MQPPPAVQNQTEPPATHPDGVQQDFLGGGDLGAVVGAHDDEDRSAGSVAAARHPHQPHVRYMLKAPLLPHRQALHPPLGLGHLLLACTRSSRALSRAGQPEAQRA